MTLRSASDHKPKPHGNARAQHATVLITPRRPFHIGRSAGGSLGSFLVSTNVAVGLGRSADADLRQPFTDGQRAAR